MNLANVAFSRTAKGDVRGLMVGNHWLWTTEGDPFLGKKRNLQKPVGTYRWRFQTFFSVTPIWGRCPFWLIFLRWVETTATNYRSFLFCFRCIPWWKPKETSRRPIESHAKRLHKKGFSWGKWLPPVQTWPYLCRIIPRCKWLIAMVSTSLVIN